MLPYCKWAKNEFYLIATKAPDVQEKAYLYKAFSPMGPFVSVSEEPVQMNRNCSRPAGNWFKSAHKLFRPAQDCVRGYGRAISIMRVDCLTPFKEQIVFTYSIHCHSDIIRVSILSIFSIQIKVRILPYLTDMGI